MKTRPERIKFAIEESGNNPTSIAKAVGCTAAAVQQWINGDTKNLKNDLLFKLADATGFEARWIATGEGQMNIAEGERGKRLLKIYAQLDERGKDSVLRAAEAESKYTVALQAEKKNAA